MLTLKKNKEIKKWFDEWVASQKKYFFIAKFIFARKVGKIVSDGKYFE